MNLEVLNLNLFMKTRSSLTIVLFFFISLFIGVVTVFWINDYVAEDWFASKTSLPGSKKIENTWNCSRGNVTRTCPIDYPSTRELNQSSATTCPEYFRWIHEDLRPWQRTGISRAMLEGGQDVAYFRLVIVGGRVYVKKYKTAFQTRDVFNIWGIVQLTRLYPGMLPDLELLFYCGDRPVIKKRDYHEGSNATSPPPVFHYCGDDDSLAIVFPDWSFWGWAEINVRPWKSLLEDIKEGNKRINWKDRLPYAYWKGNVRMGERADLMKCNVSDKYDWNGRFYNQDWYKEAGEGYKNSRLEDQCTHRYKVYIEGWGWSVSEKYILACDSMTLQVKPRYFDFFMRGMKPMQHYWPIRNNSKCRDIKFAVEWGNNHTEEALAIGKAGSKFVSENLRMENVYDYMFHLLREYAKLLKYKPSIPSGAEEVCSETMACSQVGLWRKYMEESMVKCPSDKPPCIILPPYEPKALQAIIGEKERTERQLEMWETRYRESSNA
ncbi:O-glucosyltransferase rumi [Tripterygium wilfordii]|uniref:O-glucosyltransferase rumi n=1 Tax=Tripterygium wilfordii TaxID=458696 RepID=A0A7J7CG63_TRIWF|nr:O-glucosyltransferase rumi homolog [Tripterygium wilfordii]KAF5733036.1 O-glucosyltransferase rumi [Tripterygium wilfordii]